MPKVIMYTKDPCPYCVNAKRLLQNKGVSFEEIDLTDKPEEITRIKQTYGWATVPIIVIDGHLIGGYMDMKSLDNEGKLDSLLGIDTD